MAMKQVRKAVCVGGGVIGAGWAARFLLNGIDVTVCDPDPQVERKVSEVLANARRAYSRMTLAPLPDMGAITYESDIAKAVRDADFIQESAPERIDLKSSILAKISEHAPADTIIASSTSGLLPSELQAGMKNPERLCVGHPFNPVYLLPLVEVVGGEKTAMQTKTDAMEFYASIGMHPLHVRKEVDAFIADRLLEALWREALHLVNDGVATTDEIDQAVCYGAGLRWSFMGTFLIYRLAGGEAGMRHFMEQFGPALKLPWTKLEAPELTEDLIDRIAEQSDDQAKGASIRELEQLRDNCLVSVMQGLRGQNYGAGAVLKRYEEKLYERGHPVPSMDRLDLSKPLRIHECRVESEWVDYNNHMTESRYLQVFGDTSDALFRLIGVDGDYHASGFSYYTVETHICHIREVAGEEPLYSTTQILAVDEKRIHLIHSIYNGRDDTLLSTGEQMIVHVDTKAGRACPAKPEVLEKLNRIADAHRALPWPERAGRNIGIPVKK